MLQILHQITPHVNGIIIQLVMAEASSQISILVAGGEFEAGDAALSTNEQLSKLLGIISSIPLDCASSVPGGQCRVEACASIDEERSDVVVITMHCQVGGSYCQDTCQGISTFLKSDYLGALCLEQEITFN